MNSLALAIDPQLQKTPARRLTGEVLIANGVITQAQLDVALRQQRVMRESGLLTPIGEILLGLRFADAGQIESAISISSGMQSGIFQALLPYDLCQKYNVNPLRVDGGVLFVQSARRLTEGEKFRLVKACAIVVESVKVIAAERQVVLRAIDQYKEHDTALDVWVRKLRSEVDGASLKQFISHLLSDASSMRASDIHLDKVDDLLSWVSYRIDGDLRQQHLLPVKVMAAVFTRIKTAAGMDASESRRSQDGRMSLESRGKKLDVRVASQPIANGETITLRLLNQNNLIRLEQLFAEQPEMAQYLCRLTKVHGKTGGFVIVSGATGSGKSTTLYAMAQEFDRDRVNVMTVEDPVEYTLAFCRQIQINQLLEQRATDMERSLLRQDPDVVIFGELRDENFAHAAQKLTESGHFVLSTIHANDAAQTFERLQTIVGEAGRNDMLFVLANYLKAVINQRLIKKLCECAVPVDAEYQSMHSAIADRLGIRSTAGLRMVKGCPKCAQRGHYGRTVLHESLLIPESDAVRAGMWDVLKKNPDFRLLQEVPGVRFYRRTETLRDLVEVGVIDLALASTLIGGE